MRQEGSTPHAHAVAKVKTPCDQGLVAMVTVGNRFICNSNFVLRADLGNRLL